MIFASEKLIRIVLLQLLFIIVINVSVGDGAYNVVEKVKRYLKGTTNYCLTFSGMLPPKNINEQDVTFYFASRNKPDYTNVTIQNGWVSLKHVDFNAYNPTVLISHGFLSRGSEPWLRDMKDAFLNRGAYNVIVVDWEKGSNTLNYFAATNNTKTVGQAIATLFRSLRYLTRKSNPKKPGKFGKIHFVGHSLGAHIVAHAAYLIKKEQRRKSVEKMWIVKRITGLDPAELCFKLDEKRLKLDEADAEYVDVIHTNIKKTLAIGFGVPQQIGYIDFYPNGGQMQIGCEDIDVSFWIRLGLPVDKVFKAICSHGRAHQLFIDSIKNANSKNCKFTSHPWYGDDFKEELLLKTCKSGDCPEMGINAIKYPRKKGIFFTPTGSIPPYCNVTEEDRNSIRKQLKS